MRKIKKRLKYVLWLMTGIISLAWFLIRVIPKPSRMLYPCQQAALTRSLMLAPSFTAPLIGLILRNHKLIRAGLLALFVLGLVVFGHRSNFIDLRKNSFTTPVSTSAQSKPVVVRVQHPNAAYWDFQTGEYWQYVNQDIVNQMFREGLLKLTGSSSEAEAWGKLLNSYQTGKKVAIKANFVESDWPTGILSVTAEVINAVVGSLSGSFSVPIGDIYLYDASMNIAPKIRNRMQYAVTIVDQYHPLAAADTSSQFSIRDNPGVPLYMPKVVTQADYLINIPLMKYHYNASITHSLKNHVGTIRTTGGRGSTYLNHAPYNLQRSIADINASYHIKTKTKLIVADALYGNWHTEVNNHPSKWQTFPGGEIPNSLFLSTDPVAVDSVMADYVWDERDTRGLSYPDHNQLEEAQSLGLGVHEHKDAAGAYQLIDYREYRVGDISITPTLSCEGPADITCDGKVNATDVRRLIRHYLEGSYQGKDPVFDHVLNTLDFGVIFSNF